MLKPRWDIIQCSLLQNIKNSYELEEAISSYHTRKKRFYALHEFFEQVRLTILKVLKLSLQITVHSMIYAVLVNRNGYFLTTDLI